MRVYAPSNLKKTGEHDKNEEGSDDDDVERTANFLVHELGNSGRRRVGYKAPLSFGTRQASCV